MMFTTRVLSYSYLLYINIVNMLYIILGMHSYNVYEYDVHAVHMLPYYAPTRTVYKYNFSNGLKVDAVRKKH